MSYLLNSVAPIFVSEFKEASLEYICLNLEAMLANRYASPIFPYPRPTANNILRYLEGLDEDLLNELDSVCHENQLACYPVSRGRNSEEYVFERYPEIASSVEKDKRRRIDAMALESRLSQVESYDVRPRPPASEKANASPSVRKSKNNVPRDPASSATSPMLKARQSVGDLMFQMDEEATLSPGESGKGKVAMRGMRPGDTPENRSYPGSPALGASVPEAESLDDRSFLGEQMSSPRDELLTESPTESRAIALHQKRGVVSSPDSSAPWSSPVISSGKKDLKDIMSETSQSRVSNLTLEMAGRRESGGNFTPKISQKERKKMQQQQMQEKLAAQQKAKEAPKNPWQLPPPATPSTPGKDPLPGQPGSSTPPTSEPSKTTQKPMTLRQTVAGTPPPPRSKPIATPTQSQSRSVSGTAQPSSFSKPSPSGPPTPSQQQQSTLPKTSPQPQPQPAIQSIRHIPRPDPYTLDTRSLSGGSLSLATILQQQQTEKDVIREAATAKHNLQDIQAEQEFQQWWDQESKRVQGLLEPESESGPSRGGKGGRGGKANGGGGRSRKRGGNKAAATGHDAGGQGHKGAPGSNAAPATPRKNGPSPAVQTGDRSPASHVHAAGANKTLRRGGQGHRGRGRDRGQ